MEENTLTEHELRVLKAIPIGRDNRKRITDIAKTLGITNRNLYSVINSLIMKHDIAIVSSRDGFDGGIYIPLDEEERRLGLLPLENSARTLAMRIEVIDNANLNEYKKYV